MRLDFAGAFGLPLNDSLSSGLGPAEGFGTRGAPPISSVDTKTEEHIFDSTLESVDAAEAVVLKEAQGLGFDEDDQHKIGIAVRECMVNAVVHGNRYNSRKERYRILPGHPPASSASCASRGVADRRRNHS